MKKIILTLIGLLVVFVGFVILLCFVGGFTILKSIIIVVSVYAFFLFVLIFGVWLLDRLFGDDDNE